MGSNPGMFPLWSNSSSGTSKTICRWWSFFWFNERASCKNCHSWSISISSSSSRRHKLQPDFYFHSWVQDLWRKSVEAIFFTSTAATFLLSFKRSRLGAKKKVLKTSYQEKKRSWTVITESAKHQIQLWCIFFSLTVPIVNNTSKLYIEYSFARYYKASNLTLMNLLTAYSCKQIHRSQIWCSALSVISVPNLCRV